MSRLFFIFIVTLFMVSSGCRKVSGPVDGKSVQPNNKLDSLVAMSATINGQPWHTSSAYGYYVKYAGLDSGRINLMVTATQTNNDTTSTITFTINNYSGVNKYQLDPPDNSATLYVGNTRHYATSGEIYVTSQTPYAIIGTFFFTADSTNITNGTFNIALP